MINSSPTGCDLLVISPHPDDAEIGLGGTLSLLAQKGHSCWVVDMTAGELGSNATPGIRWQEACAAARLMGVKGRARLALPDGFINSSDPEQVRQIAHVIRCLRPQWVLTSPDARRHPDHVETPDLVAKACFMAALIKFKTSLGDLEYWPEGAEFPEPVPRWAVPCLGHVCSENEKPSLFFDISTTWETKTEAIACFASQFNRSDDSVATHINDADFLKRIAMRSQRWGRLAGVNYAEAIRTESVPVMSNLPSGVWR